MVFSFMVFSRSIAFTVLVFAVTCCRGDDYNSFNYGEFEEDRGPAFASEDHEDEDNITSTEVPTTDGPFMPQISVDMIPECATGEFLRSNGSHLQCVEIPERICRCPGPVVDPTAVTGTELPTPPLGCPNMDPPMDGAFVCIILESDGQIYCSSLCGPSAEFISFPINPYRCGVFTKFQWVNVFNESQNQLPQCNGFRYSVNPVFPRENYLPRTCQDLTSEEINELKRTLCDQIDFWYFMRCDEHEDAYILCGQGT